MLEIQTECVKGGSIFISIPRQAHECDRLQSSRGTLNHKYIRRIFSSNLFKVHSGSTGILVQLKSPFFNCNNQYFFLYER